MNLVHRLTVCVPASLVLALAGFGAQATAPVTFGFEELSVPFYSGASIPAGSCSMAAPTRSASTTCS
jgi:hypothetical protein